MTTALKPLDLVRTPKGAHALVTEVGEDGGANIDYFALEEPTGEKNAWWRPGDEDGPLVVLDSLPRLLSAAAAHPFGNNRDRAAAYFPLPQ